jgi:hypothetical protein
MRLDDIDRLQLQGIEDQDLAARRRDMGGSRGSVCRRIKRRRRCLLWKRICKVAVIGGGGEGADRCLTLAAVPDNSNDEDVPLGFGDVSMVYKSFMVWMS